MIWDEWTADINIVGQRLEHYCNDDIGDCSTGDVLFAGDPNTHLIIQALGGNTERHKVILVKHRKKKVRVSLPRDLRGQG